MQRNSFIQTSGGNSAWNLSSSRPCLSFITNIPFHLDYNLIISARHDNGTLCAEHGDQVHHVSIGELTQGKDEKGLPAVTPTS